MPDLKFQIEAEDRGSRTVEQIDERVEHLGESLGALGGRMRSAEQAADRFDGNLRRLSTQTAALSVGFIAAYDGVVALAQGLGDLIERSAEYHREIELVSRAVGRSAQELDALAKTYALYGVQVDQYSDAVRTFADRLGDARFDQGSEIAEIFAAIGLQIDDNNVRFEDFLGLLDQLDSSARQFVIEAIIGGEGARILEAFEDAGFSGYLEAQIVLDQASREAILDGSRQYTQASQQFSTAVERLMVDVLPPLTRALEAFQSGSERIFEGVDNLGTWVDFLINGPPQGTAGYSTPDAVSRAAPHDVAVFVPQGPPAPVADADPGRRLTLSDVQPRPQPVARPQAILSDQHGPSASTVRIMDAFLAEQRDTFGELGGILEAFAPVEDADLSTAALLDGIQAPLERQQEETTSMTEALFSIENALLLFLPPISQHTQHGADLFSAFVHGVSGNWVALAAQSVGWLRRIFGQGEEQAVVRRDEEFDPERHQLRGVSAAVQGLQGLEMPAINTADPEESVRDFVKFLSEAMGDGYDQMAKEAARQWRYIQTLPIPVEQQLAVFAEWVKNEFADSWSDFERSVVDAWDAFRNSGELSEDQLLLFDTFIHGVLFPTIDQMGDNFEDNFRRILDSEQTAEEKFRALDAFIANEIPASADRMEQRMTTAFTLAAGQGDLFFDILDDGTANNSINVEELAQRILAVGTDTEAAGAVVREVFGIQMPFEIGGAGKAVVGLDQTILDALGIKTPEHAKTAAAAFLALADQVDAASGQGQEAIAAMLETLGLTPEEAQLAAGAFLSLSERMDLTGQEGKAAIQQFLEELGLTPEKAALAATAFGLLSEQMSEMGAQGQTMAQTIISALEGLAAAILALPDKTITITTVRREVSAYVNPQANRPDRDNNPQRFRLDTDANRARYYAAHRQAIEQEQLATLGQTGRASQTLIENEQQQTLGGGASTPYTNPQADRPDQGLTNPQANRPDQDRPYTNPQANRPDQDAPYTNPQADRPDQDPADALQQAIEDALEEHQSTNPQAGRGFARGGQFLVDRPSFFLAGEQGPEVVQITPESPGVAPPSQAMNVHVAITIQALDGESVQRVLERDGRTTIEEIMRDATSRRGAVVSAEGIYDNRIT